MSLVRGQEDQPAGVAVGTAGQQMGNFRAISEATGADEMKGPLSRGQRPKIKGNRGGCHRIREGYQQQVAEMQEQMVPWGAGEIVFSPQDGLIQDPAQPAQLQGQQCTWEKRQQIVLEDSVEECCGEGSRNRGAAASAAANERPERQRLLVVAAFSSSG